MRAQRIYLEFSDGKTCCAIVPIIWETEEECSGVELTGIKILPPAELGDEYTIETSDNPFEGKE